jgi:hypothetical protein
MRKFILGTIGFVLPLLFLFTLGLFLPPTPKASQSLIFAEPQKNSLLVQIESPRIIFVGGSNLSFGLNSQMIHDSLNLNPINTSIQASLGLKYMMDNTVQYIQKGDIVVLVPEYQQFFSEYYLGSSEELLRTIADVNSANYKLLSLKQRFNLLAFIPHFSLSKLNPTEYFNVKEDADGIYSVHSFNQYGDAYKHWKLEKVKFPPFSLNTGFNPKVIQGIKQFQSDLSAKDATLFVSYPCFQDISFFKSMQAIKEIETQYIKNGFTILGTPERYMMPDSLMFNTAYHLNKKGVDYRTELLIEDLKAKLKP